MGHPTFKRSNSVSRKKSNKCKPAPPFATLPETTLYLRRAKRLSKEQATKYKRLKSKPYSAYKFPRGSQSGKKAFDQVRLSLIGDSPPSRNLITFVTVKGADEYMNKIMFDTKNLNFIDTEVYPQIKKMEQEIVRMMGNLYHDSNYGKTHGISTIGSSEAIYVSVLLHKFKWEERHKIEAGPKLNAIYSFNTHINWDKATRWNYIQAQKILPKANDYHSYVFGSKGVAQRINKNTICVICTVATTRTGQNDNVAAVDKFLQQHYKKTGVFVPIHIDAAIGGFIAPFLKPDLLWDFRLKHVKSINVSFHKYGGTFPGMGMLVVKSDYSLPQKFKFTFNVEKTASSLDPSLSREAHNFNADPHAGTPGSKVEHKPKGTDGALDDWYINFSKPSSQIVTAYYLLNKLGYAGYRTRMSQCVKLADYVAKYINSIRTSKGPVFIQINEPYYPSISFKLEDYQFPLQKVLTQMEKKHGWSIAAYRMDPSIPDVVMRLVIKPSFTMGQAKTFIQEFKRATPDNRPQEKRSVA